MKIRPGSWRRWWHPVIEAMISENAPISLLTCRLVSPLEWKPVR